MSSHVAGEAEQTPEQPAAELSNRLGYLLKHANQRLTELTSAALEPYHLNGRELGVLVVLDAMGPTSQQDAARRLGVDRTTMVALIDAQRSYQMDSRAIQNQDQMMQVANDIRQ